MWEKLLAILLLFFGEAIVIYVEVLGAHSIHNDQQNLWNVFRKFALVGAIGGIAVVLGYFLGIKLFQNIWVVTVISITSILIVEPIVVYAFFKEVPTNGALIGLILGALGFASAIWLK